MQCGPGNGRKTSGGGDKVPHNGWPAVTGILWKVLDSGGQKTGGPDNDELLGHHGSDRLFGGAGKDILWGDWDPSNNNTHQQGPPQRRPGQRLDLPQPRPDAWSRPAPARTTSGPTTAAAPSTAAPGKDTARVKLNGPWKLHNCERVLHFCAFGSDGHGGCLKPGEKKPTGQAPRSRRMGRGARRPLSGRAVTRRSPRAAAGDMGVACTFKPT